MNTIKIAGATCIPLPIDGKNLTDCWEELFSDFTSNVIGGYKQGRGIFSFRMEKGDESLFLFHHQANSHEISFLFPNGIEATRTDIFILKREMEQICTYCREASGNYYNVRFTEWSDMRGNLERMDAAFYVEIQ